MLMRRLTLLRRYIGISKDHRSAEINREVRLEPSCLPYLRWIHWGSLSCRHRRRRPL